MCVCVIVVLFCFVLLQTETHFVALEFTKIHVPVPQGDIFKINHREDLLRTTCCQGWGDGSEGESLREKQEELSWGDQHLH